MKSIVLFHLFAIVLAYTDLDDNYHFEGFIQDSDELKNMLNCFLDKGPCAEVLLHYKSHIEESFDDACAECTELQKHHYKTFLTDSQKFHPEDFNKFLKIYDKHNRYGELQKALASY